MWHPTPGRPAPPPPPPPPHPPHPLETPFTCVQHGQAAAAHAGHAAAAVGLGDVGLHPHRVGPGASRGHHGRQRALSQLPMAQLTAAWGAGGAAACGSRGRRGRQGVQSWGLGASLWVQGFGCTVLGSNQAADTANHQQCDICIGCVVGWAWACNASPCPGCHRCGSTPAFTLPVPHSCTCPFLPTQLMHPNSSSPAPLWHPPGPPSRPVSPTEEGGKKYCR